MTIENIISIATVCINALIVIFYFIAWLKTSKKNAANAFEEILKSIPNYANLANGNWGTQMQKANFILAMIKSKCEELNIKFKEKTAKEAVNNYLGGNNNEKTQN